MDNTPEHKSPQDRYPIWKESRAKIEKAFYELINENNEIPNNSELADKTGLHINTIQVHTIELRKEKFEEKFEDLKSLSRAVVLSQAVNAIKNGSAQSAQLFLRLVEGWDPTTVLKIDGNISLNGLSLEELLEKKKEQDNIIDDPRLIKFTRNQNSIIKKGSDRAGDIEANGTE